MSRIQQSLAVPPSIDFSVNGNAIEMKSALGKLNFVFNELIFLARDDNKILLSCAEGFSRVKKDKLNAQLGTAAAHLRNMVKGLSKFYEKKLILTGVGYKVELKESTLLLNVRNSHLNNYVLPGTVKATVEKNVITLKSVDKQLLGQVVADIIAVRPLNSYNDIGISIVGEKKVFKKKRK